MEYAIIRLSQFTRIQFAYGISKIHLGKHINNSNRIHNINQFIHFIIYYYVMKKIAVLPIFLFFSVVVSFFLRGKIFEMIFVLSHFHIFLI